MADVQGEMSKSAKRRAAKKARDAGTAEEAAPPAPPAPEPKAKAKAKAKAEPAAAPAPAAEPKAKAKGKAKAKAEPTPPAPEPAAPKAKAKGKAKAESATASAPAAPKAKAAAAAAQPEAKSAPAPKAAGKAKAKAAAAAAAKAAEEEEQQRAKESTELLPNYVIDDGSGPAWEVSAGVTKKQQKRKERAEEEKKAVTTVGNRNVPGLVAPTNTVPGMGPAGKAGAKGASQSVAADVERILAMKTAAAATAEEKQPEGNTSTATVHVPEKRVGIVIGPKGAKIKMIQEKTGVARIDTTGELFTISGPPAAVTQAETAIKELVEKGYCALQYDDFAENYVNVHPSYFPDLIGKQGAVVRKIKEELGVEINFPETQKNAPTSKKYKVGLAGSTHAVEQAKNVINNIMMYSHDALTHPDTVHDELEIESWAWRYIIGTAGSEMRHIQNNYKVKVAIPREHSLNQKVLVVGSKTDVERAKAYIEKLVWNAENKTSGRDKVDDGDTWGDEAPEEEWMRQYMYKR